MKSAPRFATAVLYVDDVSATLIYYDRALGLRPSYYDAALGFALLGEDQSIAVCSHAAGTLMMEDGYTVPDDATIRGAELAFWSDDVANAFARAVEAGGAALSAPRTMPWGQTVAYVRAPEGTILGFLTPVPGTVAE